jgi:hypothetical protein
MTAIDRTAYPRFKETYSAPELHSLFIPTPDEMTLVNKAANSDTQKLTLLILLKCCQSMGYIPHMKTIPEQVVQHIHAYLGLQPNVSLTFAPIWCAAAALSAHIWISAVIHRVVESSSKRP